MLEIVCEDYNIDIYDCGEDYPEKINYTKTTYVILRRDCHDPQRAEIEACGFRFHDRILRMRIDPNNTKAHREAISQKLIDMPISVTDSLDTAMYDLACRVYKHDRRFHLDEQYDMELASKSLKGYFDGFSKRNIRIFETKVPDTSELLGFTVLELKADGTGENILGVTKNDMRGKMAAWGIYNGMLKQMECGNAYECRQYCGNVSSSNAASINLHINLGGRVESIYDEYIKKIEVIQEV